jgi:hypothetical protein
MSKLELIDTVLLESVHGAGAWDAVDNAVSWIPGNHDWKDQACAARGSWVGTAYGVTTGLVGAGVEGLGPYGQFHRLAIAGTKIIPATSTTASNRRPRRVVAEGQTLLYVAVRI